MGRGPRRLQELERHLVSLDRVAVAFSGGVDSTLLAAVAARSLGEHALAITVRCQVLSPGEVEEARELAQLVGVRHVVLDFDWLAETHVAANPSDRCYHCKLCIFSRIRERAARAGIEVVADGTNTDDTGDYRPGLRALTELGVRSPFVELGIGKAEIREMSRLLALPRPDRPSGACLASRVPYGVPVTGALLHRIDAAEDFLRRLGLAQVRVRVHGEVARIEVDPQRRAIVLEHADAVVEALRAQGFIHVALDLRGYRTGSLNEALSLEGEHPSGGGGRRSEAGMVDEREAE